MRGSNLTAPEPDLTTATQPAIPSSWPAQEGEFILRAFRFRCSDILPELRMHYTTLGTPRRDIRGRVTNAVLLLHVTGGSGQQFLAPQFADTLFGPGQPLDIDRYYLIFPDSIGHGRSSKPSDGLRAKFPAYDYDDMVEAQRLLLINGLNIDNLRLVLGTSMGGMHSFVWGVMYPNFARAIMPIGCLPAEIAGHNRALRKLMMDGIRADPAWRCGNYESQPTLGLRTVVSLVALSGENPVMLLRNLPCREAADNWATDYIARGLGSLDANDFLFQLDSSRNYNPSPSLARIKVPLTWVNSADDFINPPLLGIVDAAMQRMPSARFMLIPQTAETRGHATCTWPKFWKDELIVLLERSRS